MDAQIIERSLVYDGWYRLQRLTLRMPDGALVERHLLDNGSAVAALPYDPERRVAMLVQQPRAPVLDAKAPPLLEAIAGSLDGATPEERIREEALEEAGLELHELQPLANIWSLAPVSQERIQLYLATYQQSDRIGEGGGADGEHENITVCEVDLSDLSTWVRDGSLTDAKTLILAQALMLARPDLFSAR